MSEKEKSVVIENGEKKAKHFRFNWKTAVSIIALAVIVYIISKTDFSTIIVQMKLLPVHIISILILLQIITQLALNYQWYRICKVLGLKASFFRLLAINAYGMVADAVTPGEKVGGEVARVVQMNSMLGYDTKQSTSIVTIQKSLSLTALVVLNGVAVVTLSSHIDFLKPVFTRIILYLILGALTVFFIFMLFFTDRLNAWVQNRKSENKAMLWFKNWMNRFAEDTKAISVRKSEWAIQLLLSFVIWILFPVKLIILVSQYGRVGVFVLLAATFVSYFAAMIPLLPGGLGTFESAMSGILIVYGLTMQEAVAVSLIFRFVTFWFVVLFSLCVIAAWKISQYIKRKRK